MSQRPFHPATWAAASLAALALSCSTAARAQVKLEYKFPEGQKQTYKTTATTSQVLKIAGQSIETEEKKTIVTATSFGKKRDDGTQPVTEKVEAFATELSLPGGINVAYDSKDPNSKIDQPGLDFLDDIYKLITQLDYTVVLGPGSKVQAVEGTEKIMEKVEKLDEKAKVAMKNVLNEKHLKEEFEQSHGNLPEVLARPGEPWERTENLAVGGGQTLTFRKKYEYAGTEKRGDARLDKINVKTTEVKYAMDADAGSPLKVVKSDLKVDSGDGVILFDREAGHVVSSKATTRIKGPMTFEANGQELPGELDLTIATETELQPPAK